MTRSSEPALGATGIAPADHPEILRLLQTGELDVVGRVQDASNLTLFGSVSGDGVSLPCVYKPVRGEQPLWDFPDGTLAEREVLAHDIAVAAGWFCVPPTVLRPGSLGVGMVQLWVGPSPDDDDEDDDDDGVEDDPDDLLQEPVDGSGERSSDLAVPDELVAILPVAEVTEGWLPVFRAREPGGGVLAVCHRDDPRLALLAGFDAVVNNADRKAPHLVAAGSRIYGVDHGLTFHIEDKLRTILWGWAGRYMPDDVVSGLERLSTWLREPPAEGGPDDRLTRAEVAALRRRVEALRRDARFPEPPTDRTPIPWPPL